MFTFLKMLITWHNAWFWRVSSLHFILNNLFSLLCWCHINVLNVILNFIITEYIYLAFANVTFQIKILSQLSISILMMWSASIWWRCESHYSFMFSCTSRTCTFNFNFIIEFSIHKLTVMLNLFNLWMKCVSLYFFKMNVASWVWIHFAQILYAQLNDLQIDFVILS